MVQTFPWPVTDDELGLNRALENVVAAYGDAGLWKKPGYVKLPRT